MADCIFLQIADKIKDSTYSCYDGRAASAASSLSHSDRLLDLAERNGKQVSINLFGQEIRICIQPYVLVNLRNGYN